MSLVAAALRHWPYEPFAFAGVVTAGVFYVAGLRILWKRAGVGRGIERWRAAAFGAGMLTLAFALLSPLAWLSGLLFSAHMTQHELFMLVAAPLLVLGRPGVAWIWALPPKERDRTSDIIHALAPLRRIVTNPVIVFAAFGSVMWIVHVPAIFNAGLADSLVHALQHSLMLATALLFWSALIEGRYGVLGYGASVVFVFATALHTGLLGAGLAFSMRPWYAQYVATAATIGVDPLADQQIAGALMWIPASVFFIVVGLALFAAWIGASERRAKLSRLSRTSAPGTRG